MRELKYISFLIYINEYKKVGVNYSNVFRFIPFNSLINDNPKNLEVYIIVRNT